MSSLSPASSLCDPVLIAAGFDHGFGQRDSQAPEFTVFSRQVHGIGVLRAQDPSGPSEAEADIVFTSTVGVSVGIVTADCVPILVASPETGAVAAIHAGWRGLAAGVIERGLAAFRSQSGGDELVAAVGPAARGCCYEVDDPVREGLAPRYAHLLEGVLVGSPANSAPAGPRHYQFDLPRLVTLILEDWGLVPARIGTQHRVCTICDPRRFESFRRDGAAAGRLKHFISHAGTIPRQG